MKSNLLCTAMGLLFLLASQAYAERHHLDPFGKEEEIKLCPVEKCVTVSEEHVRGESYRRMYGTPSGEFKVEVTAEKTGVEISVRKGKETVLKPVRVTDREFIGSLFFWNAYVADLNGDGRLDFVVPIYQAGMGLRSGTAQMVFILSSEEGYRVFSFYDASPSPNRFIDLKGDGACWYVHTHVVYANYLESIVDGKRGNFYVYSLLRIDGEGIKELNSAEASFPRWVRIGQDYEPRGVMHLTEEMKKELLEGDFLRRAHHGIVAHKPD